ncbi:LOW-MOLECULAR-WEIGHT CYSTEINE-RICH 78 [Hibiscus trionum]|uniref:LOW-MOLECULAR-WEIGHT CYSTEINE-RICH 78 n=1 Tax=Hibiscus trionum TaxID=183268 RepID=A0A9W7HTB1_HIBTR|nr:LOW-MOLECULAR-WEIGHT CYSTEINE-RICH 78 [Hibiscus trionum]
MAKLFVRLPNYTFLFLWFLLILLVYSGTRVAEAQLCSRRSQTSIGFCTSTLLCDRRCREMEGALNGACLRQVISYACFCYVRC